MNLRSLTIGVVMFFTALGTQASTLWSSEAPQDFPTLVLSASVPDRIDIGPELAYLSDPEHSITPEQAMQAPQPWKAMQRSSPNFGFTNDAYWFRFAIDNQSGQTMTRYLELPRPFLDDVRLFHRVDGMVLVPYVLGDEQPFNQRVVQHPNFVMPLLLQPGINELYLRIASLGTVEAPLILWEPGTFYAVSADEHLLVGAIAGVLLIMVMYNLFVYLSTRDLNYVYYIAFVASYLVYWLTQCGYSFAYLWPQAVHWNNVATASSLAAACTAAALFTNSFLKLHTFSRPAYILITLVTVVSAVLLLLTTVLPYNLTIRIGSGLIVLVSVVALLAGYWRLMDGARFARFFCLAWTSVFAGFSVLMASKFGLLPINAWVDNASQIGILLLVVLLSFTLADRINNDRNLRLNAQAVALAHAQHARAAQQALIRATEDANHILEERVNSRTSDLNKTLEQLQIANDKLKLISTTDGLTQVHNRAYFDQQLQTEHKRATRLKQPLALILFDIDHFKKINDTYGHPAGDACLRHMADFMRVKVQRAGDLLARYGGEEFVVLLINSTLDDAMDLAEEFRKEIAELSIPIDGKVLRMTASFGVASQVPGLRASTHQLISDADRALYQAKSDGRNCVRAAPPRTL